MKNIFEDIINTNHWVSPIKINRDDLKKNTLEEISLFIMKNKFEGIIPIFLKNHDLFFSLTLNDINGIITKSYDLEGKSKLGVINLVDLYYKYVNINLLENVFKSQTLNLESKRFIINYFYDLPIGIYIDYALRESTLKKFEVPDYAMQKYQEKYLLEGAEKAYSPKIYSSEEKGELRLIYDKKSHELFFRKYISVLFPACAPASATFEEE